MANGVTLPEAQYWKLKALSTAVELAQIKARQMVEAALLAQSAYLEALAKEHDFDASVSAQYQMDDATCTLRRLDAPIQTT